MTGPQPTDPQCDIASADAGASLPWSGWLAPANATFLAGVSLAAFLLLGYHPYAEDGGIYAAALEARLDAGLFTHDRAWVLGHTRFSCFVPTMARLVSTLHASAGAALLLLQMASVAATVCAIFWLAAACIRSAATARWATLLCSLGLGLPVAGTSLYIVDPCPTARSVTTPLLLFAAGAVTRRRYGLAVTLWLVAVFFHPLMAGWAGITLLLVALLTRRKRFEVWQSLAVCSLVVVALVAHQCLSSPADAVALTLARTRAYWFLSQWRPEEWAGILLPVVLLLAALRVPAMTRAWTPAARQLALAAVLAMVTATAAAALCAWSPRGSLAVAELQPLRMLHLLYPVVVLLLSASLLGAVPARLSEGVGVAVAVMLVCGLGLMQRSLYPASGWLELPGSPPRNGWEQAFLWAGRHTPRDALFALDSAYTTAPGEDAQGFRAIAERSALPDAAKDAGIAAVVHTLAPAWASDCPPTVGLNTATDAERRTRLLPPGVSWIVLPATALTALDCPYRNRVAAVCALR